MRTSFRFSSPFIIQDTNNKDIFIDNTKVFNVIDKAPYELSIIYTILSYEKEKIKEITFNENN